MKKLERPEGLVINFSPSSKQYILWNSLQGNRCDKCGGQLEMKLSGYDKQGHPMHEATCVECGNTDIPELILGGGAAGGGKCLSINSLVCTPFGFRPLKELKVGDIISNPLTGKQQRLIYIHPKGRFQFYRIHFVDGTSTECSEGHLWRCHQSRKKSKKAKLNPEYYAEYGDDRIWTTTMMYEWYQRKKEGMYNQAHLIIPLTAPVEFSIGNHPRKINSYVLGALIGDGCITNKILDKGYVEMTTMDEEIVARFEEAGYDMSHHDQKLNNRSKSYRIYSQELIDELKKLGIAGNRSQTHRLPRNYKLAPLKERIELMQGLIDTDGYVDDRGHVSYTSTSKQLAEDVAFVVRSLGGVATVTQNPAGYKDPITGEYKQCCDTFDVQIRTKINPDLCGLTRKKKRAKYEFNGGASELGKRITNIEKIGKQESFCITVDDPSGLYITDNFTVTHNSFLGCSWVVKSCLEYPGIRMVLARKELKNLLSTTWSTMIGVLNNWGLKQDIHYHINNQRIVLTFWNGSTISGLELAPSLQDPDYARLGSLEITGGFIDEASEVLEKAVEVLQSRIRYRIAETFVVGKLLLCSNPSQNWIRSVFVQDDDGNPVKLKKGYRYLPFSLFDNPDENFRMIYFNRLRKIRDKATRQRLLYGNWDYVEANKMSAYYNFDGDKHIVQNLQDKKYNPMRPLVLSFDFNVNPYMSCLPIQFNWEEKEVCIFKEIIGKPDEKNNNAPAFGRFVAKTLKDMGNISNLLITGDPAGLARSSQTEVGVNNYTIITKALNTQGFPTTLQLFRAQPSQISRLDFMNELLNGYAGWHIFIDIACRRLVDDLVYQKKNPDGTKEKKKVLMENGTRAEKYGHLSDCFDYALCYYLSNDYNTFINGGIEEITTIASDDMYGDFDY